jgi:CheY-like chemotaxis protein
VRLLRALKAGAKAYLQKPWNDSGLRLLISKFLGQPGASAAAPQ